MTGCAYTPRKCSRVSLDYFDTVCSLVSFGTADDDFNRAADGVFELLKTWHERLDVFEEYDGANNLCTLNRCAGEPVALDDETLAFLEWTLAVCELTDAQVNPVMGRVTLLWKECAAAGDRIPTPEELQSAAEHISPDLLVIDRAAGTATLTDPEAWVDVGAFGKGYVADRAADWLIEQGYDHFAIDLGGNIRLVGGKTEKKPWVVGVEDPRGGDYLARLSLKEGALATSGSYQRYYEVDGVRYHHIIDPDTLMPGNTFLSVSVSAPDAATTDALSTALFNMTPEAGKALMDRLDGVSAIWVYPDGRKEVCGIFAP